MSRTRQKAKGRRGGEAEKFAFLPESLMRSPAGQSLPHAAFKLLAIMVVGRSKERNGTMCCSESYAAEFGITSRDTVRRSLIELQQRGIITITRRVEAFKKWPTLYAVTWWPITHRDGEPLRRPEEPTFDYLKWPSITPISGVENAATTEIPSHRWSDTLTPTTGVENVNHHTDGDAKGSIHHTDGRGQSSDSGGGTNRAQVNGHATNGAHAPESDSIAPSPSRAVQKFARKRPHGAIRKAQVVLQEFPALADHEVAAKAKVTTPAVKAARALLDARVH